MVSLTATLGRHRTASRVALSAGIILALIPAIAAAVFVVNAPWVRPAGEGRRTEAYMVLTSTAGATLVEARSDVAALVSVYSANKNAVRIERLPLPAGKEVKLAPGGTRLGLSNLSRPLKLGDRVPFTLTIESADGTRQEIQVNAEVRRRSAIDDHRHPHHY
jgi:copper(I)-binding protein